MCIIIVHSLDYIAIWNIAISIGELQVLNNLNNFYGN